MGSRDTTPSLAASSSVAILRAPRFQPSRPLGESNGYMSRAIALATFLTLAASAVVPDSAVAGTAPAVPSCDLTAASPWIRRWFDAWELTSREILKLPDAEPP